MHVALAQWEELLGEYRAAAERRGEISRQHRRELKRRVNDATIVSVPQSRNGPALTS